MRNKFSGCSLHKHSYTLTLSTHSHLPGSVAREDLKLFRVSWHKQTLVVHRSDGTGSGSVGQALCTLAACHYSPQDVQDVE